jgi:hypothetical protein
MQATFSVYRKEPGEGSKPGRSTYTVEVADDATVMDALLKIRDEQDPTLGFRGSCLRGYSQHAGGQGPDSGLGRVPVEQDRCAQAVAGA